MFENQSISHADFPEGNISGTSPAQIVFDGKEVAMTTKLWGAKEHTWHAIHCSIVTWIETSSLTSLKYL